MEKKMGKKWRKKKKGPLPKNVLKTLLISFKELARIY